MKSSDDAFEIRMKSPTMMPTTSTAGRVHEGVKCPPCHAKAPQAPWARLGPSRPEAVFGASPESTCSC